MKIYYSSGLFPWKQLNTILDYCRNNNIFNVELGPSLAYSERLIDITLSQAESFQFILHNYFPPPEDPFVLNLASSDADIHRKSMQMCKAAIRLSSQLKAPFYSIHAGFAIDFSPSLLGNPEEQLRLGDRQAFSIESAYERFVENVRTLSRYAKSNAVQLLVENNVISSQLVHADKSPPLLLSTPDEIIKFFSDVNDKNIGLLLDTGHAKVTAGSIGIEAEAFFNELELYIRALHLSDNNGKRDTNQPFEHDCWFAHFLKDYRHLPLIIEVYNLQPRGISRQQEILKALLLESGTR